MKRRKDRYFSEPQKVHPTGEFVIVAKFGGHALRHLASRLANASDQAWREGGMLVLVILTKKICT